MTLFGVVVVLLAALNIVTMLIRMPSKSIIMDNMTADRGSSNSSSSSSSSFNNLWPMSSSSSSSFIQNNANKMTLKNPEMCYKASSSSSPKNKNMIVPPTGIVVTLLLGSDKSNPQLLNGLCSLFDSQLTHFIVPQDLDVLFVLAGNIQEDTIVKCLNLKLAVATASKNTATKTKITTNTNTNTTASTTEESTDSPTVTLVTRAYHATTVIAGKPFVTNVWVSHYQHDHHHYDHDHDHQSPNKNDVNNALPFYPKYLLPQNINNNNHKSLESQLQLQLRLQAMVESIEPPMCRAPVEYIQGTRWYTNEMLHLKILQNYDYFVKLDPDVVFVKPLDFHILYDLQQQDSHYYQGGAILGHAGEYPPGVPTPCSEGISRAVQEYIRQQQQQHHKVCQVPFSSSSSSDYIHNSIPDADRYYTNFLIGRVDFFTSPQVRRFGQWLSQDYEFGFFHHRWTDQIFWQVVMDLFLPSPPAQSLASSNSNFTHSSSNRGFVVVDYTDLRCFPLENCWMSSLQLKEYANLDLDVCQNGGSFVHTKHAQRWVHRWNRHLARKEPTLYDVDNNLKHQIPHVSKYRHDCRGTRWSNKKN